MCCNTPGLLQQASIAHPLGLLDSGNRPLQQGTLGQAGTGWAAGNHAPAHPVDSLVVGIGPHTGGGNHLQRLEHVGGKEVHGRAKPAGAKGHHAEP